MSAWQDGDTTAYPGGQQWRDDHEPGSVPPGPGDCIVCGSTPARTSTVWLVTGVIVWVQWQKSAGPFCRTCGTAVVRHHTNRTMLTGWWGVFAFPFNLFAIAANAFAGRRFAALAPPVPHADVPGTADGPLDTGAPLLRRPGPYVAILIVAAVIAVIAAGLAGQADRDASGAIVKGGDVEANQLKVGDCFDIPQGEFVDVTARPCSEPHDAELVGIVRYPGPDRQPYPSQKDFFEAARGGCMKSFAEHVGIPLQRSALDMSTITPSKGGWGAGDRQIQCVVTAPQGKLKASVRDSRR